MNRNDVTEKIISTKVAKGLQWEAIAKKVGQSKEWTTALCLGQMTATPEQAKIVGKIFGLTAEEQKWLQVVPYKGSLPTPVPTDPLIYRWHELVGGGDSALVRSPQRLVDPSLFGDLSKVVGDVRVVDSFLAAWARQVHVEAHLVHSFSRLRASLMTVL